MRVTGDFKQDVNDPLFQDGEQRVFAWLKQREADPSWPWVVVDRRGAHREGDFQLISKLDGRTFLLDVKVDQWSVRTGRFAWEEKLIQANGRITPGWGKSPHLDYIAYVIPQDKGAERLWETWIVDAKALRTMMVHSIAHKPLQTLTGHNWKSFDKRNTDGRRGCGWAVPKNQVRPYTRLIVDI